MASYVYTLKSHKYDLLHLIRIYIISTYKDKKWQTIYLKET